MVFHIGLLSDVQQRFKPCLDIMGQGFHGDSPLHVISPVHIIINTLNYKQNLGCHFNSWLEPGMNGIIPPRGPRKKETMTNLKTRPLWILPRSLRLSAGKVPPDFESAKRIWLVAGKCFESFFAFFSRFRRGQSHVINCLVKQHSNVLLLLTSCNWSKTFLGHILIPNSITWLCQFFLIFQIFKTL